MHDLLNNHALSYKYNLVSLKTKIKKTCGLAPINKVIFSALFNIQELNF